MKNDLHYAYRTTLNFPLHISSPDGVRAHMADQVRLISQLPGEWPKVRGRHIANRKNVTVVGTFTLKGHTVEKVQVNHGEGYYEGKLVDGKYFFTDAVLNNCMDLELMLTPFAELEAIPMVRREWNHEYPSSNPFWYALVPVGTVEYANAEPYVHIDGYSFHGITCMVDLLAYSYKFRWNAEANMFEAITDEHEITKRIRKPWMQHLVQCRYGENPSTEADLGKLVSFLLTKVDLSEEEQAAVSEVRSRVVTLEDLKRVNERHAELNKLLDAYNSLELLTPGVDVDKDPMFALKYF